MSLLLVLAIGLMARMVARALSPGEQSMWLLGTIVLGVVGSFIGGAAASFVQSNGDLLAFTPSSFIWSTLGALLVLLVAGLVTRRRRRVR